MTACQVAVGGRAQRLAVYVSQMQAECKFESLWQRLADVAVCVKTTAHGGAKGTSTGHRRRERNL